MKTELYKITTLSNLHVGAGDINFDVIDNQVQRDSITKLPNINSSSLKGAFREHFSKEGEFQSNMVKYIFGPDNKSNDSHQTGAYSFFEAQLLSRPVRSSHKAFFNATSPKVLKSLLETIENFGINFDTGNSINIGYSFKDIQILIKHTHNIHLKDKNDKFLTVRLGSGLFNFRKFFNLLKKEKYSKNLILQTARNTSNHVNDIKKNIKFVEKLIKINKN